MVAILLTVVRLALSLVKAAVKIVLWPFKAIIRHRRRARYRR
jgi:hypothetical protein